MTASETAKAGPRNGEAEPSIDGPEDDHADVGRDPHRGEEDEPPQEIPEKAAGEALGRGLGGAPKPTQRLVPVQREPCVLPPLDAPRRLATFVIPCSLARLAAMAEREPPWHCITR